MSHTLHIFLTNLLQKINYVMHSNNSDTFLLLGVTLLPLVHSSLVKLLCFIPYFVIFCFVYDTCHNIQNIIKFLELNSLISIFIVIRSKYGKFYSTYHIVTICSGILLLHTLDYITAFFTMTQQSHALLTLAGIVMLSGLSPFIDTTINEISKLSSYQKIYSTLIPLILIEYFYQYNPASSILIYIISFIMLYITIVLYFQKHDKNILPSSMLLLFFIQLQYINFKVSSKQLTFLAISSMVLVLISDKLMHMYSLNRKQFVFYNKNYLERAFLLSTYIMISIIMLYYFYNISLLLPNEELLWLIFLQIILFVTTIIKSTINRNLITRKNDNFRHRMYVHYSRYNKPFLIGVYCILYFAIVLNLVQDMHSRIVIRSKLHLLMAVISIVLSTIYHLFNRLSNTTGSSTTISLHRVNIKLLYIILSVIKIYVITLCIKISDLYRYIEQICKNVIMFYFATNHNNHKTNSNLQLIFSVYILFFAAILVAECLLK